MVPQLQWAATNLGSPVFVLAAEAQLFEQTDDLGSVLSIWIRDEAVCISVKQILVKLFGYFKCTSA